MGFLAAEPSLEAMGPHNRSAWETAKTLGDAKLLLRQANGEFADPSGATFRADEFDVLWYHQGDSIDRNSMYRGPSLTAIRRFAEGGRGVLLSGGALALVLGLVWLVMGLAQGYLYYGSLILGGFGVAVILSSLGARSSRR